MADSVMLRSSAVEFWYEYSETDDPSSQWYRTYGLEHWVNPFGNDVLYSKRFMIDVNTAAGLCRRWADEKPTDEREYSQDRKWREVVQRWSRCKRMSLSFCSFRSTKSIG